MTIKDTLLKAAGLVCWAKGCSRAATHGSYCMGHKHLRFQKRKARA